jgi:hypothetical protein
MRIAYLNAVILVLFSASSSTPQEASLKDFQEYGDLMVGRWIGDLTLVADWPGFGNKGDKVVAHLSVRWIADRNAVEGEAFAGAGAGRSFAFWDPVVGRIKEYRVSSKGTVTSIEIWKLGDKWAWRSSGYLRDRTPFDGHGEIIVSEARDTITYVGKGTMGGKPMLPLKDVFRKACE